MFELIIKITDFLWGTPLILFVVGIGLYLSYCCNFFQITKIKYILNNTIKNIFKKSNDRIENERKTISTVLAGTIGTGNVAGIASALAVGGPGAIFWMWIISFISMATKMAEVALSVKYREKTEDSSFIGGPMYYIKHIAGKLGKILAIIYSIALLIYVITDACFAQMNTLATSINETFNIHLGVIGILVIILSVIIISRGFDKTSNILKKLVPIMTFIYLLAAMIVILFNFKEIPNALFLIFKYAFQPAPILGGFMGSSVMMAISKGASRGIFANEAGLGTAATVYVKDKNATPLKQGMWGIMEVALVSFGTCTLTSLLILTSGVLKTGETGAILVLRAFESLYGDVGKIVLSVIITLFAYSTYLGFFTEFKTSIIYLVGTNRFKYFSWLYFVPIIFAVLLPIEAIWSLSDISVGFIIIPNLVALLCLSKEFRKIIKENKLEN